MNLKQPTSLFFETLLNITDHEEFTKDDEFNLKTSFQEENLKDSNEIFSAFSLFDPKRKNSKLKPIKEPKILKRHRKEMEDRTLGNRWGDMKKQDANPELESDLTILQLRKFMNPKFFFKSSENKALPKYFQVGTIMDGGDDFVGGRLKKKERKNNLIDMFLTEDKDLQYSRKKFLEIQKDKQKYRRNKSNSKFRKLKKFGKKIKKR